MPARATSSVVRPASTCFSAAIICASVCLLRLMHPSPFLRPNRIPKWTDSGGHLSSTRVNADRHLRMAAGPWPILQAAGPAPGGRWWPPFPRQRQSAPGRRPSGRGLHLALERGGRTDAPRKPSSCSVCSIDTDRSPDAARSPRAARLGAAWPVPCRSRPQISRPSIAVTEMTPGSTGMASSYLRGVLEAPGMSPSTGDQLLNQSGFGPRRPDGIEETP